MLTSAQWYDSLCRWLLHYFILSTLAQKIQFLYHQGLVSAVMAIIPVSYETNFSAEKSGNAETPAATALQYSLGQNYQRFI